MVSALKDGNCCSDPITGTLCVITAETLSADFKEQTPVHDGIGGGYDDRQGDIKITAQLILDYMRSNVTNNALMGTSGTLFNCLVRVLIRFTAHQLNVVEVLLYSIL